MSVVVVGSANVDLLLPVRHLPLPGQTVLSAGRAVGPGGKGLNQAVAAARAGAATTFVAALGDDAEGALLRGVLADERIEPVVRTVGMPTGLAVVMVDERGENSIVVAPGANAGLVELRHDELLHVRRAGVLLAQLEIAQTTVTVAAEAAREEGVLVVLNASPAAALEPALLAAVDVLLVNEGEAVAIAGALDGTDGYGEPDLGTATERLLGVVRDVVVTLGAEGSTHRSRDGSSHHEPALRVPVVDTTAAGDTFAGYLAAGLADRDPIDVAVRRAAVASALCVQRRGAVASVPTRREVDALSAAGRGDAP